MTVLYGSAVANGTLSTACTMTINSGGVETSKTTVCTGTNTFVEIQSQGNAGTTGVASIPATPTGNGWVFLPGAGTFALGNWSASVTLSASSAGVDITIRFFKYTGSYTSIGTINKVGLFTAKTTYAFTATSMAAVTFAATDLLYVDLFWHDNTSNINGDNPVVYESTTAIAGVINDMQITTSTFTPSSTHRSLGDGLGGVFS